MSTKNTTFYNIGVSYIKTDAQTRGRFSLSEENQNLLLEEVKKEGFEGVFVLSTCNRTEISGFAEHPFQLINLLCKFSEGTVEEFAKVLYVNKTKEAIHHLFRMGTGLDSQILGDYEIVGNTAGLTLDDIGTNPTFVESTATDGSAILRWMFNGEFPIDSEVTINYCVQVNAGESGVVPNTTFVYTPDRPLECNDGTFPDDLDYMGNGPGIVDT